MAVSSASAAATDATNPATQPETAVAVTLASPAPVTDGPKKLHKVERFDTLSFKGGYTTKPEPVVSKKVEVLKVPTERK